MLKLGAWEWVGGYEVRLGVWGWVGVHGVRLGVWGCEVKLSV